MAENGERMLLVSVAAQRLGYSDRHVRRLVQEGKLASDKKTGRNRKIPESAVETFQSEAGES